MDGRADSAQRDVTARFVRAVLRLHDQAMAACQTFKAQQVRYRATDRSGVLPTRFRLLPFAGVDRDLVINALANRVLTQTESVATLTRAGLAADAFALSRLAMEATSFLEFITCRFDTALETGGPDLKGISSRWTDRCDLYWHFTLARRARIRRVIEKHYPNALRGDVPPEIRVLEEEAARELFGDKGRTWRVRQQPRPTPGSGKRSVIDIGALISATYRDSASDEFRPDLPYDAAYDQASSYVHSDAMSLLAGMASLNEARVFDLRPEPSSSEGEMAILLATYAVLRVAGIVALHAGVSIPERVLALNRRFTRITHAVRRLRG